MPYHEMRCTEEKNNCSHLTRNGPNRLGDIEDVSQ